MSRSGTGNCPRLNQSSSRICLFYRKVRMANPMNTRMVIPPQIVHFPDSCASRVISWSNRVIPTRTFWDSVSTRERSKGWEIIRSRRRTFQMLLRSFFNGSVGNPLINFILFSVIRKYSCSYRSSSKVFRRGHNHGIRWSFFHWWCPSWFCGWYGNGSIQYRSVGRLLHVRWSWSCPIIPDCVFHRTLQYHPLGVQR